MFGRSNLDSNMRVASDYMAMLRSTAARSEGNSNSWIRDPLWRMHLVNRHLRRCATTLPQRFLLVTTTSFATSGRVRRPHLVISYDLADMTLPHRVFPNFSLSRSKVQTKAQRRNNLIMIAAAE